MGFVKVVKNKGYFRRFQVKYRRRRECRTDYYARKRLILQDKNKYLTPKYRLVVRVTNRDIVTQIISAGLTHDHVLASSYSHELPRYGIKLGLTNYAAAYATGLLLARRVNQKFKLKYEGNKTINGEDYNVEAEEEGAAPFKALLDVGLARTTTGARIFGALKGATDGGIDVPHNDHRFPGSKREGKEWSTSPETHKKYIFGGHVAAYMKQLHDEDEEHYARQFKRYQDAGITHDKLEKIYKDAHAAIRKEPTKPRGDLELGFFKTRAKAADKNAKHVHKKYNRTKLALKQKQSRITQILTHREVKPIKRADA